MLFSTSSVKGQLFSSKIRPEGNNFIFSFVFNSDGSCRDNKVPPPVQVQVSAADRSLVQGSHTQYVCDRVCDQLQK